MVTSLPCCNIAHESFTCEHLNWPFLWTQKNRNVGNAKMNCISTSHQPSIFLFCLPLVFPFTLKISRFSNFPWSSLHLTNYFALIICSRTRHYYWELCCKRNRQQALYDDRDVTYSLNELPNWVISIFISELIREKPLIHVYIVLT